MITLNGLSIERRAEGRSRRSVPSPADVVYPGPAGSHTAVAAAALFPSAHLQPLVGFRAVAEAVAACEASYGVLPIESSLAGAVAETHDLLYEHELAIIAETVQPIVHCLAATEPVSLDDVHIVRSHPTALEQCRRVLHGKRTIPASTTADAARLVAQHEDPHEAALASPEAAALYGLTVIADDVGDHPAFTRFVTVAAHSIVRVDDARMAFSFVTDHRPGALHTAITPLAEAGLDLQRLVSRPLPETPFQYRFDAVVAGHPSDPAVRDALRAVQAVTRELRVLGVYSAHEEKGMSTIAQDEYVTRTRREISDIDRSLVELVNKRLKLVAQLWRYKDEHGLNHVDPAREEWMLQYLHRLNRGPLSSDGLAEFHHELLELVKRELGRA